MALPSPLPPVLVTGGAGYVGSHAVLALLDAGATVVVLDDLSTGSMALVPNGAQFVRGQAGNMPLARKLIRTHGIEAVMHFAASIRVEESVERPDLYYRQNVSETLALVTACAAEGVKSLILSSTAAVYGEGDGTPLEEEHRLAPINPYGRSKAMAETILEDIGRAYAMATGVLRYFNVAGADPAGRSGQASHTPHHLIEIATQVLTGHRESLTIFGTDYPTRDGTALRDYVHVSDVAQAHLLLLRHSLAAMPRHWSYNVGYGRGSSVRDVVCALSEVAERPVNCRLGGRRRGDPAMLIADSSRIQQELGWRPRHDDLQSIVGDALRWEEARQARDAPAHAAVA